MTEIIFRLEDDVVRDYGELYVRSFVEKQMEHLSLIRAMDKIEEEIKISKLSYDKELESVRQEAWDEYKKDFSN